MQTHELKILPEFFKEVRSGNKTAELRIDDRDFTVGDVMVLREWLPRKKVFTGRFCNVKITHMVQVRRFIETNKPWVMLSFRPTEI